MTKCQQSFVLRQLKLLANHSPWPQAAVSTTQREREAGTPACRCRGRPRRCTACPTWCRTRCTPRTSHCGKARASCTTNSTRGRPDRGHSVVLAGQTPGGLLSSYVMQTEAPRRRKFSLRPFRPQTGTGRRVAASCAQPKPSHAVVLAAHGDQDVADASTEEPDTLLAAQFHVRPKCSPDIAIVQLLHRHAQPVHHVLAAARAAGPAPAAAAAEDVEEVGHAAPAAAGAPHALLDRLLAVLHARRCGNGGSSRCAWVGCGTPINLCRCALDAARMAMPGS